MRRRGAVMAFAVALLCSVSVAGDVGRARVESVGSACGEGIDEVSGRVLLLRPDGVLPSTADATLYLAVRADGKESTLDVPVVQGRFRAELPNGAEVRVINVRGGDGNGVAAHGNSWLSVTGADLDIEIRIPLPFELRVYGADGREQLRDVQVFRKERYDARLAHPGSAGPKTEVLTAPSDSPIQIRVEEPIEYTYYCVAPGYAFGRLDVDPFLGGVQTLQLEPGGVVDFHVVQPGTGRGLALRVRRETERGPELVAEFKRYPDRLRIEGLKVGRYSITSEDPVRPNNMPIWGIATFELSAGESKSIELTLAHSASFDNVAASGVLRVPAAWGPVSDLTVVLRRIDPFGGHGRLFEVPGSELVLEPGYTDVWRWRVPSLPPGGYDVGVRPLGISVFREVHGGGNQRVDIDIAGPRDLALRLVEDPSGAPAEATELRWAGQAPDIHMAKLPGITAVPVEAVRVTRAEADALFRVRAPKIELEITLDDPRYELAVLAVPAGQEGELVWRVRRATGIRVRLVHEGEPVSWSGNAVLQGDGFEGRMIDARWFGDERQFDLSAPGMIWLRLPPIEGYRPPLPRRIEVPAGEVVLLTVELEL